VLRLAPPLVIEPAHVSEAIEIIDASLADVKAQAA
jgi:4-aminobutyrate aminotransferase-like enzyme